MNIKNIIKKIILILIISVGFIVINANTCHALIGNRIAGIRELKSDIDSNVTNVGNLFLLIQKKDSLNKTLRVKEKLDDGSYSAIKSMKLSDIIRQEISYDWKSTNDVLTRAQISEINKWLNRNMTLPAKSRKITDYEKAVVLNDIVTTDKMLFVQQNEDTFGADTELYCIQHDAGAINSDYRVHNFVQIKGNKITKYKSLDSDLMTPNLSNEANAILTYILNKPNNYGYGYWSGPRQYAARHYVGDWIDKVGKKADISTEWKWNTANDRMGQTYKTDGEKLIQEAKNAANENKVASIKASNKNINIKTTDSVPVTLTFNGTLSISVKDTEGKTISDSNLIFKQDGKTVVLNKIKYGKIFYIETKNNQLPEDITFKVTNTGIYCANIWFTKTTGCFRHFLLYDQNNKRQTESQRLMIVDHFTEGTSAQVKISVNYKDGSIKIIKVDEDNEDKELSGAKFIVRNVTKKKWLGKSNDGKYSEVASVDKAKEFKFSTNSKGVIEITDVPDGTYEIYEIGAPKGYQLQLQVGANKAQYDSTNKWVYQGEIKVENKKSTSITVKNKLYKGTIRINKKDPLGNALDGATFIIYVGHNKFLGVDKDGDWDYTVDRAHAKRFTTTDGTERITNLKIATYYVWEIDTPDGYELSKQAGYKTQYTYTDSKTGKEKKEKFNYVYISTEHKIELTKDKTSKAVKFVNIQDGSITINKKDANTNKALDGAKFIIHLGRNKFLGKDSDGNWIYNATRSKAFEITTKNGTVTLNKLKLDKRYLIYEIRTPNGYNIEEQDDYKTQYGFTNDDGEKDSEQLKHVHNAEKHVITLSESKKSATVNFTNTRLTSIEGFVWEDAEDGKTHSRDNLYKKNTNDRLLGGIRVHLKDLTTNKDIYQNSDGTKYVTTDQNGHYEFKKIKMNVAENAYVEFEYDNITYIPVKVNQGGDSKKAENSKAQPATITKEELDDNNLTGTSGAHPGRAVTKKKKQELVKYLENDTYKIKNINLGLVNKLNDTHDVEETLEYVKVKIKDYTYTYKYGKGAGTTSNDSRLFAPVVRSQDSATTFRTQLYITDVAANAATPAQDLQVYVVYSIGIKNETNHDEVDRYVEQKQYINSLTNTFDGNRYELCGNVNGENTQYSSDFNLWTLDNTTSSSGEKVAKYSNQGVYKHGIAEGQTIKSYIQFRVKDEMLKTILQKRLTEDMVERVPTWATVDSYQEYLRTDNIWEEGKDKEYNGAQQSDYTITDANNNTYYVHRTRNKQATSSNVFIRLQLKDQRTLTGTVFEDTLTQKSEGSDENNLGDGILSDTETNRANNVYVELLDKDKQTVSNLYQVENGAVKYINGKLPKAATYTDDKGEFKIEGVVPGYYYIRFTYPDGTKETKIANEVVKATEYKSTIIDTKNNGTSDENKSIIRDAMEWKGDLNQVLTNHSSEQYKRKVEWYKYLNKDNKYSTAVDSLKTRKEFEGVAITRDGVIKDASGNDITDTMEKKSVDAYTPIIGISIENDLNDNANATTDGIKHEFTYDEFNFGLIKPAPTSTKVEKKITNVKLVGQVGSTLVSANPTDKKQSYVTALDEIAGGSGYAKLEIDPENIYGSNLETTYEVAVKNDSLKDYIENVEETNNEYGTYYKYGLVTESAVLKKVTINEVIDSLDEKYNAKSLPTTVTQTVTKQDVKRNGKDIKIAPDTKTTKIVDDDLNEKVITEVKITDWEPIESSETSTISYTVTSLLSADNDDTKYGNGVKITSLSLDKLTTLKSSLGEEKLTRLTITPTTGRNRNNIYLILALIGLTVVSIVIVMLKKKIF